MKTQTLSVRLEQDLIENLDRISEGTGIERANIVRALLIAVNKFYQENGYIQMPLRVVPLVTKPARGSAK